MTDIIADNFMVINFFKLADYPVKEKLMRFVYNSLSERHSVSYDYTREYVGSDENKGEEIILFLEEFGIEASYWCWKNISRTFGRGIKIKKTESLTNFILKYCS